MLQYWRMPWTIMSKPTIVSTLHAFLIFSMTSLQTTSSKIVSLLWWMATGKNLPDWSNHSAYGLCKHIIHSGMLYSLMNSKCSNFGWGQSCLASQTCIMDESINSVYTKISFKNTFFVPHTVCPTILLLLLMSMHSTFLQETCLVKTS